MRKYDDELSGFLVQIIKGLCGAELGKKLGESGDTGKDSGMLLSSIAAGIERAKLPDRRKSDAMRSATLCGLQGCILYGGKL